MLLIIGLGNPGEKYAFTRHNVGFMVADALADRLGLEFTESKYIPTYFTKSDGVEILKPTTYVNESGLAVSEAIRKHPTDPEDVWVIHDDTEIPLGEVRVKFGGTSGGHNGIKSIDEHITADYWRVRVGVGRPAERSQDLAAYVLSTFAPDERELLKLVVDQTAAYLLKSLEEEKLIPTTFNAQEKH